MRASRLRWPVTAVAALAAAACLAAGAGAATFGTDLGQPANNPITCDQGWPNQLAPIYGFGPLFYNPGNASCMWTSGGFYAPQSGTVTAVRVKVGQVTGPMQIVVLRSLFQNTITPGKPFFACCVVQSYGPTFTPAAGAVTTVPTSLPVQEDATPPPEDLQTIAAGDLLALAVLAPGVPVPATTATNGGIDATIPDFAWFPAPSLAGIGAPSTNVIGPTGDFSGYRLLMSADTDGTGAQGGGGPAQGGGGGLPGAGGAAPVGGAGGGPGGTPLVGLPRGPVRVQRGTAGVPLTCAGADCAGLLLFQSLRQAGLASAGAAAKRRKPRTVTYGSARFSIPAGTTKTVKVRLNAAGRRLLKTRRTARVWANIRPTKGSAGQRSSGRLKLTGARA